MTQQSVDAFLVAVTMLNTPDGHPASSSNLPSRLAVSGTFSLGFRTNVCHRPLQWEHPERHHGRKVVRRDANANSQGVADGSPSTSRPGSPATGPMSKLGPPQANSTPQCRDGRWPWPRRQFAVFTSHHRHELIKIAQQQFPILKKNPRSFDSRRLAPTGDAPAPLPCRSGILGRAQRNLAMRWPVDGLKHFGKRVDC